MVRVFSPSVLTASEHCCGPNTPPCSPGSPCCFFPTTLPLHVYFFYNSMHKLVVQERDSGVLPMHGVLKISYQSQYSQPSFSPAAWGYRAELVDWDQQFTATGGKRFNERDAPIRLFFVPIPIHGLSVLADTEFLY